MSQTVDVITERAVPTTASPSSSDETTPARTAARGLIRRRTIGNSDLTVFPMAIGGNVFGWTADAEATSGILDTFVAAGGNFIDTADSYSQGQSEQLIGDWMHSRRNRDSLVVATKVGKSADYPGLSRRTLTAAVHASLERLGTDHIDLLYLHIDDDTVEFDETLLAVDDLIRSGKVRYFGGSDHTGNRLIEARIASGQLGIAHMVALQNHYNLLHRDEYEGDLAHVAASQRLGVMPRFALASGFLSGKYRQRSDLARYDRGTEAARHLNRRGLRILGALDQVAEQHETTVAAVSLAWLLTRANVVAPVVSARSAEQVADLIEAPALQLTRHQVFDLDRASRWGRVTGIGGGSPRARFR